MGVDSIAIGSNAQSSGLGDIAIGLNASASGNAAGSATAIGNGNIATGAGAVAIGDPSVANGTGAFAGGFNSYATSNGTALGGPANGAVAIGNADVAFGQGSVALGNMSTTGAAGGIAMGDTASAKAADGVALGSGSTATNANDVALGAGSKTAAVNNAGPFDLTGGTAAATAPNSVVSVGDAGAERRITNVAAGNLTATSTDAVNGSQLYSVANASLTLGNNLALTFGGGMTVNPNGTIATPPSYLIAGNTYNDVGSALAAINSDLGSFGSGGILYFHTNSVLADSTAGGLNSTAIGPVANANGASSIAMGNGATANGNNSVAIGAGATAAGGGVAIGAGSTAAAGQVNVGTLSVVGTGGAAITQGSNGLTVNATQAQLASGANSVTATGAGVTLAGGGTLVTVNSTGMTLNNAKITGVAPGTLSAASTDAVNGSQLYATNQQVSSLTNSVNTVLGGIAYDNTAAAANPTAAGQNSLAVGPGATSSGQQATAVGNGSSATGPQSTALGNGANSTGTNSVALGAGSTDGGASDVVSVGSSTTQRKIINLAAGTISATSTDAVNGSQLNATNTTLASVQTTANGALQRSGGTMTGSINMGGNSITNLAAPVNPNDAVNKAYVDQLAGNNTTDIANLKLGLNDAFKQIDKASDGVAVAIAMGGGFLSDNKKAALWANYGNFQGRSALAFEGYARLDNNWIIGGSIGYSLDQQTIGTRVGIGYQW